eukprot:1192597-Prorocentrum_minimum.AAC.8
MTVKAGGRPVGAGGVSRLRLEHFEAAVGKVAVERLQLALPRDGRRHHLHGAGPHRLQGAASREGAGEEGAVVARRLPHRHRHRVDAGHGGGGVDVVRACEQVLHHRPVEEHLPKCKHNNDRQ